MVPLALSFCFCKWQGSARKCFKQFPCSARKCFKRLPPSPRVREATHARGGKAGPPPPPCARGDTHTGGQGRQGYGGGMGGGMGMHIFEGVRTTIFAALGGIGTRVIAGL